MSKVNQLALLYVNTRMIFLGVFLRYFICNLTFPIALFHCDTWAIFDETEKRNYFFQGACRGTNTYNRINNLILIMTQKTGQNIRIEQRLISRLNTSKKWSNNETDISSKSVSATQSIVIINKYMLL